jgi:hypothetical protein
MYKAILLAKLLYASVVWWPKQGGGKEPAAKHSYVRAAVPSMKTTLTEVLEIALYQTPLHLAAIGAAGLVAYSLKCQEEWRDAEVGHTKLDFLRKYPFTLNQDKNPEKISICKAVESMDTYYTRLEYSK